VNNYAYTTLAISRKEGPVRFYGIFRPLSAGLGEPMRVVAHHVGAGRGRMARDASQPWLRQTGESFQGVGCNSSTGEVRRAAAKWPGEVVWTQFNSTVVHFVGLCARYLTDRVYQIVETAWGFWPRDGLSRRRRNQSRTRRRYYRTTTAGRN
jgi:hypothetical protein